MKDMNKAERQIYMEAVIATQRANPGLNLDYISPAHLHIIVRHTRVAAFVTIEDTVAAKQFFDEWKEKV